MEFTITHLLLTLALGGTAIVLMRGTILLVHDRFDELIVQSFSRAFNFTDNKEPDQFLLQACVIAITVCLGVILEDVASDISWNQTSYGAKDSAFTQTFLPKLESDRNLRVQSLFSPISQVNEHYVLQPTPLLANIAKLDVTGPVTKEARARLNSWLSTSSIKWRIASSAAEVVSEFSEMDASKTTPRKSHSNEIGCLEMFNLSANDNQSKACFLVVDAEQMRNLVFVVNQYYYSAKNFVFQKPEYNDELRKREERQDFERAFCTLFFYSAILSGFTALWNALLVALEMLPSKWHKFMNVNVKYAQHRVKVAFLIALLSIGASWMTGVAYRDEARSFYLRVYGYSISLFERAEDSGAI
jgi:hypothetical protein